jgi:hypothetical protein
MTDSSRTLEDAAILERAKGFVDRYVKNFAPLLANPYIVADRAALGCRRTDMRQFFVAVWLEEGGDASELGLRRLAQRLRSLAQFQAGIGDGLLDLEHDNLAPQLASRIRQAVDRDRLRFAMSLPSSAEDKPAAPAPRSRARAA